MPYRSFVPLSAAGQPVMDLFGYPRFAVYAEGPMNQSSGSGSAAAVQDTQDLGAGVGPGTGEPINCCMPPYAKCWHVRVNKDFGPYLKAGNEFYLAFGRDGDPEVVGEYYAIVANPEIQASVNQVANDAQEGYHNGCTQPQGAQPEPGSYCFSGVCYFFSDGTNLYPSSDEAAYTLDVQMGFTRNGPVGIDPTPRESVMLFAGAQNNGPPTCQMIGGYANAANGVDLYPLGWQEEAGTYVETWDMSNGSYATLTPYFPQGSGSGTDDGCPTCQPMVGSAGSGSTAANGSTGSYGSGSQAGSGGSGSYAGSNGSQGVGGGGAGSGIVPPVGGSGGSGTAGSGTYTGSGGSGVTGSGGSTAAAEGAFAPAQFSSAFNVTNPLP